MSALAALPAAPARLAAVLVLAIGVVAAAPSTARGAEGPEAFVQGLANEVIEKLLSKKISDAERVRRLRDLLVNSFDVPAVGKFVLGLYWRRASEKQKEEFLELYKTYVVHNYAGLFKKYAGENVRVAVTRSRPVSDSQTAVYATIRQPAGPPVSMEMKVRQAGETHKALDLKIEGVSMPLTHRKQFASVIQRRGQGVEGLLEALRNAVRKFEAETPSQ